MEEHVEGHVDAQPTQDLTEARQKALDAHQGVVQDHAQAEETAKDAAQVDHAVADDPDEMQVSSRNVWFDPKDDEDKQDYLSDNPPVKYEQPAKPVSDVTDRSKDAKPVQVDAPTPERHEHTAHEVESRDLTVDDADFDAEEKGVDANG